MAPGTEFARDFCAGIGPLQLGVVLVCIFCHKLITLNLSNWKPFILIPDKRLKTYTLIKSIPQINQKQLMKNVQGAIKYSLKMEICIHVRSRGSTQSCFRHRLTNDTSKPRVWSCESACRHMLRHCSLFPQLFHHLRRHLMRFYRVKVMWMKNGMLIFIGWQDNVGDMVWEDIHFRT